MINRYLRSFALNKIAGTLTDLVEKSLNEQKPKPIFTATNLNVGPGTSVMIPNDPIKSDGSFDMVINIRGIQSGDVKTANNLGVNAVVVSCEAGGMGSKENREAYGSASFVNNVISKVSSFLQSKFPDQKVHRGRLAITGFSGGGSPIAAIASQEGQVNGGIDSIIIADGLHSDSDSQDMIGILNFAQEAQKDPNKKFVILHSAIPIPNNKYSSTTQTSDYLLKNLGINRDQVQNWDPNWAGKVPVSQASSGGVKVLQLYDKPDTYYDDPTKGLKKQHIDSMKTYLGNMGNLLGWN